MATDIALYVYSLRENEIIEKTVSCFLNRLILIFKKRFVRIISEKKGDFDLNGQKNLEHEIIFEDVRTQLYFACYTGEEKMLLAHWHEHLELVYVLEGEMTAYSQDSVYELVRGDLFLANTSEIHYTHTHCGTRYCLLQIPPAHLKRITPDWKTLRFQEYIMHSEESGSLSGRIGAIFRLMLFLQERKGQGDQLLLLSEVFRLLYLLDTEAREEKSSGRLEENVRDLERIKQTMEYIQDHYQEPLTLSDGAAFLSVTPEHFCRLFKKYTGQTFLGYLGQVRMTHFYEDLSGEDKITLLLDRHGIRNYKVFLREFKKNYGQTPQQVRRKIS